MKHILAPIFALVLLFPSLALGDPVDWDDLVKRDVLYYEESSDVPFTGEVVGYWDCLPSAPLGQIELIA